MFDLSRRDSLKVMLSTGLIVGTPSWARAAAEAAKTADVKLYGGSLVVGVGSEPRVLNPGLGTDFNQQLICSPIYGNLIGLDFDFNPQPELAHSWSISPDGKVYTFNLNKGVKWHDGKPFTSADVAFTFEKILGVYHGSGQVIFKTVESMETPDENTIIFKLKAPYEPFLVYVGRDGRILPKHLYENTDARDNPVNLKPVGTGPFRIGEWKKGSYIMLERNPDFYDKSLPFLDKMIFKFIPDSPARLLALESGEIDYLPGLELPLSGVDRLKKNSKLTVTSRGHETWAAITEMMLNHDRPPFNDVKVRRAIIQAIDRNFINEKAGFNLNHEAVGPISSEYAWAYTPDVRKYAYDPAAANKLLDEAGVKRGADGVRFQCSVVCFRSPDVFGKAAAIVAEQLKEVGIAVKVNIMDRPTAIELVYTNRNFDMFIHSLTVGPDPAIGVARQYLSTNIRPSPFTNACAYKNLEVDKLLDQAGKAPTHEERGRLYREVSKLIVEDAVMVWLYEDVTYSCFSNEFKNMHTWSADSIYRISRTAWSKGKPRA